MPRPKAAHDGVGPFEPARQLASVHMFARESEHRRTAPSFWRSQHLMHSWLTASPERFVTDVPGSHRSRPDLHSLKAPQLLAPPRRHDSSPSGAFVRVEMATSRHLIRQHGCRGGRRQDRYRRLDARMPPTARDSQQAKGPEVASRRERRSPEPRAPHWEARSERRRRVATGRLAANGCPNARGVVAMVRRHDRRSAGSDPGRKPAGACGRGERRR